MRRSHFAALVGFVLLALAPALAQTPPPTGGAAPATDLAGGSGDWWWVILLVLVIALAIGYFVRRRKRP